ncbi:GPP34 family phosphoprotein [Actinoplanes oblitus]|uniref:GPP34 family phosphoprotein n=1 Tax=Actinoplanes oblitus TaxID=3040509 RepID=A0ABY8WQ12_9ACTN|nr:GPP34 family phosphoprotein [Actinoplanes oblitus]WIM99940.1 GPP34 family phosphoprotein [Actinoplanes oblitus]
MSGPVPQKLTDKYWLAAHDSLRGKPRTNERVLGIGLAAGLLGELVHDRCVKVRDGRLLRVSGKRSDDPALYPLLSKMVEEERRSVPPVSSVPRQPVKQFGDGGPAIPTGGGADWPTQEFTVASGLPRRRGDQGWLDGQGTGGRHAQPPPEPPMPAGHDLRLWMSYLACDRRADLLVIERLTRAGFAKPLERWWRPGSTVRYVPYDSAFAGAPASAIREAVKKGDRLAPSDLLLAGLMFATGLHQHALASLTPSDRRTLSEELSSRLDSSSRQLLKAADAAVGEAALVH